jgi:hypothetical protein
MLESFQDDWNVDGHALRHGGLVPAIRRGTDADGDGRDRPGHDGNGWDGVIPVIVKALKHRAPLHATCVGQERQCLRKRLLCDGVDHIRLDARR